MKEPLKISQSIKKCFASGLEHTKHTGGGLNLSLAPLEDLKALVLCKLVLGVSGGFRGGDGGDASPPTSPKVTILAEKSAPISNNSAPFRDASLPTSLNVTNPAEKSLSILVKTFFFFFFWRPPDFEFPISAEKSLSILVKTSECLRFCA